MVSFIPPVLIELLASAKEFNYAKNDVLHGIEEMKASGATMSQRFSVYGQKMATGVLAGAAGLAVAATKMAYDYNEAIDKIGLQSNMTAKQVEELKVAALDVSRSTATSATDIANAFVLTAKAGLSVKQSQLGVASAAQFAKAENVDLNQTLTAALGVQAAHMSGTSSLTQTMDIFTNAVKNSRISASQLTDTLSGRTLSIFASYGIDIKTATALLGGFADINVTGTKATQGIATALAALDKPMQNIKGKSSASSQAFSQLGLNQATLAADVRRPGGFITVLEDINTAWEKNASKTQRAAGEIQFLNQVFGSSGGRAAQSIIQVLPQVMKIMGTNTSGATAAVFSQWLTTTGGAVANFKTQFEDTLITVGNVILPKVTDVLKQINGWMKNPGDMQNIGIVLGTAFVGAVGMKLYNVVKGAISLVNSARQLIATQLNTTALQENTDALLGKTGGGGIIPTTEKYGKFAFTDLIPLAILGLEGALIKKQVLDPTPGAIKAANSPAGTYSTGSTPTSGSGVNKLYDMTYGGIVTAGMLVGGISGMITKAQDQALTSWSEKNNISQSSTEFAKALQNFVKQDQKGNYSVTVTVK